jgi:hypothetical protein
MSRDWGSLLKPLPVGPRGANGAFAETAWLPKDEARQLVGAIGQLEPEIARWVAAPDFELLAYRIASELARAPLQGLVGLGKEVVLDFAAELLGLAEVFHARHRYATAFALEGVAGRLIEGLIAPEAPAGASCEPTRVSHA